MPYLPCAGGGRRVGGIWPGGGIGGHIQKAIIPSVATLERNSRRFSQALVNVGLKLTPHMDLAQRAQLLVSGTVRSGFAFLLSTAEMSSAAWRMLSGIVGGLTGFVGVD